MDAIYRLGVQLTPAWNAAVVDHQYQPALHIFGVDQVSLRCKENTREERRNQVWRNADPQPPWWTTSTNRRSTSGNQGCDNEVTACEIKPVCGAQQRVSAASVDHQFRPPLHIFGADRVRDYCTHVHPPVATLL